MTENGGVRTRHEGRRSKRRESSLCARSRGTPYRTKEEGVSEKDGLSRSRSHESDVQWRTLGAGKRRDKGLT